MKRRKHKDGPIIPAFNVMSSVERYTSLFLVVLMDSLGVAAV